MDYNKAALEMHETHHGKVGITSKVEVKTRDDLSTAYTPGVAEPCRQIKANPDDPAWRTLAAQVTDANGAIFDVANGFTGCISGIHEILHRQGLMPYIHCLCDSEHLSAGQAEEIDRVCRMYPHLTDDAFVRDYLRTH